MHSHCNVNMTCFINKHIINLSLTVENVAQFLNALSVLFSSVTAISPITERNG